MICTFLQARDVTVELFVRIVKSSSDFSVALLLRAFLTTQRRNCMNTKHPVYLTKVRLVELQTHRSETKRDGQFLVLYEAKFHYLEINIIFLDFVANSEFARIINDSKKLKRNYICLHLLTIKSLCTFDVINAS